MQEIQDERRTVYRHSYLLRRGVGLRTRSQQAEYAITSGVHHLVPQDSGDPMKIPSVGRNFINRSEPNTSGRIDYVDTLGPEAGYFADGHVATGFATGIPPTSNLEHSA